MKLFFLDDKIIGDTEVIMINLDILETEKLNKRTEHIDRCDFIEIVDIINDEDKTVPVAIAKERVRIAELLEYSYKALKSGGRLIYIGAGTSGRLGVLDASECPPTYGVSDKLVIGLIAGGSEAMFKAKEGAEDYKELGINDLKAINLSENDMVIGLAASGRTPYVIGALEYANSIGADTGSIACVSNSEIGRVAKHRVEVVTGGEVVSGSTRMKAGSAQKMVLNIISTGCMIKLGKVFGNLMVDVQPTNDKLIIRGKKIIAYVLKCDEQKAEELFKKSNRNVKVAIVMGLLSVDEYTAKLLLEQHDGKISDILEA